VKLGVCAIPTQTAEGPAAAANGGLAPGALLDGRFAITDVFCRGGMATIFKARDLKDHGAIVAENASPGLRVKISIPLWTEPVSN